jgi:acetyl-CoA carboxylase biotin carboxylase subunit
MTIQTLLIANRGEIACRIIRTCRRLGIRTVAVYSEAEAAAPHVRAADAAVCVGPPPVTDSYLNVPAVLDAARRTGADAIHPGYGLLSERTDFARAVADAGLIFVGPSPEAIQLMGSKTAARARMAAVGVPVVPGTGDAVPADADPAAFAQVVGYPLMVKASDGGGGIGMTVVHEPGRLAAAVARARRSAARAFGSDAVYFERYVERARHVEVQVFGDMRGTLLHLGDRECSVQRRHQKVTEEAPAPALSPDLRARMARAAVRAAEAVGYTNAGTVEFLVAPDDSFYFLEMNTRLQVEHPVTEETIGLDLVELQLRVAAGEPLPLRQEDVRTEGHAIECRLYAEDPATHLPSPGTISTWRPPAGEGVRVDAGVEQGSAVTPLYDPLLAKLIAWGPDRHAALSRMQAALDATLVEGVKTNLPLLRRILRHAAFVEGRYSTDLIPQIMGEGVS